MTYENQICLLMINLNYCELFQDQQTALILAARCNHIECVKVLLETNADVDAEDVVGFVFSTHDNIRNYRLLKDNWTALLNACQNGNLDIVRVLVEHGAQLEHADCVSCE